MSLTVREFLNQSVLLFDGATGTLYAERSKQPLEKSEEGNIKSPDIIREIHREYIDAGAMAIKTNTYGANRKILDCGGRKLEEIIRAAWTLAVEAIGGREIFLFASIGPIPGDSGETEEQYRQIIDIFLDLGAENFLFETFGSCQSIIESAEYIRGKRSDAFIIASYAVNPDGFTAFGEMGSAMIEKTLGSGYVDASGFNCVSGPANLRKLSGQISTRGRLISIMPNAGFPTVVGSRTIYGNNPVYFGEVMKEIAENGVKILGGCCGTSPSFISEISKQLKGLGVIEHDVTAADSGKRRPAAETDYQKKLARGEKIIAVELDPPADSDINKYISCATDLRQAGTDIITIADCPVARSRMDSSIVACKLRRELGIEPMPHMTCRDRNLNATKALLLGLSMEEVGQVLIITGDPVPNAERDSVKSVYNFNSRMLMSYVCQLNETLFSRPFYISAALNINAHNFDPQLRMAQEKVKCGAKMFLTQPVLTTGMIPPKIFASRASLAEQYKNKDRDECTRLAVEISTEIAKRISGFVDGYYIITPFSRTDIVCEIISGIKQWM